MSDLISRKLAIELLENTIAMTKKEERRRNYCVELIKAMPSAQPKRGKWIIRDNPGTGWYRVTCSECGEDVTANAPCIGFFPNAKVIWNYCPECGADMRGEEEWTK